MLTKEELLGLIQDIESSRAERTVSVNDTDKFCEAVCAFANDMPDSKQNGYLLVGVHDDGRLSGLKATDSLLKNLAAIRSIWDYRSTGPTMFYQYADRIELLNSGGLYGRVNRENFPDENDYRNPIIADAMRTLGYVNRFGRGIGRVHIELEENGNGEPLFDVGQIGSFKVTVCLTKYAANEQSQNDAGKISQELARTKEACEESSQRLAESSQRSPKSSQRLVESSQRLVESSQRLARVQQWANEILSSSIRSDARRNMINVIVLISENSSETAESMSQKVGITARGVQKILASLQKLGVIKHEGPNLGGHWRLIGFDM